MPGAHTGTEFCATSDPGTRVAMAPIMIDDDSEDDLPLMARPKPGGSAGKKPTRDSSSSEPEWMRSFKSPVQKIVDDLSDDDDDDDAAFHAAMTGRSKGGAFEMGSTPAKIVTSPAKGETQNGDDDDDDDDDDVVEDLTKEDEETGEVPVSEHPVDTESIAKKGGEGAPVPAPAPSIGKTGSGPPDAKPGPDTNTRVGELPLFVPAALNKSKVFFEIEGVGEAVDLEGDVGVVGRLLTENSAHMQMDLKGVVYNARILSTPCSVVILAVNQTEAKVESVSNDFVQLVMVDTEANNMHAGATLDGYLGGGDSDDEEGTRVGLGASAAAAVRGMADDVSDDGGGGKRKSGGASSGGGARKARKLGADGKSSSRGTGKPKAKKKPKKRPKKK